jgi:hypothetical protein
MSDKHTPHADAHIHINPRHKGLLHKELGVPQGQKIPEAKLEAAKHSSNPAERKRANFAINFGHKG